MATTLSDDLLSTIHGGLNGEIASIGEYPSNIVPGTKTVDVPGSVWTKQLNTDWMNNEMKAGTTFCETSRVTRHGTYGDLELPMLRANPNYTHSGPCWVPYK